MKKPILVALFVILAMGIAAYAFDDCSPIPGEDDYYEGCEQPMEKIEEGAPAEAPLGCGGVVIWSCTCLTPHLPVTCLFVFCNTDCCLEGGYCTTTGGG